LQRHEVACDGGFDIACREGTGEGGRGRAGLVEPGLEEGSDVGSKEGETGSGVPGRNLREGNEQKVERWKHKTNLGGHELVENGKDSFVWHASVTDRERNPPRSSLDLVLVAESLEEGDEFG